MAAIGKDIATISDDDIRTIMTERARRFFEEAPTTAAAAATDYSRWSQRPNSGVFSSVTTPM